ncbi:MAG: Dihydropteroate synthase [Chlamydiales bacterium]|nr:Dihydropteroate synthase [Chlamydiales bacterium]MCH9635753.1 Dihydropteroate synthase [Chlamydiales bacterium]MCH9703213.1 dihydropteroate synthase [Chlamydiota bacterium]
MRKIVAIVNCTPDSFFDGGAGDDLQRAKKMIADGADILDIGGESTRPGHTPVSEEEELRRVIPIIEQLKGHSISIDTQKPTVAEKALDAGATILNDVSGFCDPAMRELADGQSVILMHGRQEEDLIPGMLRFFEKRIAQLPNSQIILDPGIGFGKSVEQNYEVLRNLNAIVEMGLPVLMGLSRKSFMQKVLNKSAAELLPTTLALNTLALIEGVEYIRVHDVAEHRDILTLMDRL